MEKIRNLSVRKTILLYLLISLVCSFFLSAVIVKAASRMQQRIWWKYVEIDQYFKAVNGEKEEIPYFQSEIPRPLQQDMNRVDYCISEACDFLQTYTVLLLSVMASCAAVFLFYRHKLQQPLKELHQASKQIAGNDLDFHIMYKNQDEMGRLCQEFERMRGQLALNNQKLWRMIEEEKVLRAAIAHDIRSPLSVLKGYQEMLLEYLPDGTIDIQKAVEMLTESGKQINRMDLFVETMRRLNSLEQRSFVTVPISAEQLNEDIHAELMILNTGEEKQVSLETVKTPEIFWGDKEVVLEVAENLLSNALRYAKNRIEVQICVTSQELRLCVADDGGGFREDAGIITKAFYQQNVKDSLSHAGMGMYISRLYCEKHGGKLLLTNGETGGAVVTAIFRAVER